MPEGDTIYRIAATLRSNCEQRMVESVSCCRDQPLLETLGGRRLTQVEARGKHLLLHFDTGQVLHSHMGMTGSWHLYADGASWRKPAKRAAVCLQFDNLSAVCFSPKVLELLSAKAFQRHARLRQLGPDVLGSPLDVAEVLRRLRIHNGSPVGEVILNQTVLCGLGNVYKSEILFLQRIDPFERVASLSDESLVELLSVAQQLVRRNLNGQPRRTRFAGDKWRMWVYGRNGQPCFECGDTIAVRRQGDLGRTTYWCPACQRTADSRA